jgi:hypothetical protein
MAGYLIDEGGDRTHAVLPVEEYERLTRSAERLDRMREYAPQMMATIDGESAEAEEGASNGSAPESHGGGGV